MVTFPSASNAQEKQDINLTPEETVQLFELLQACDAAVQDCAERNADQEKVIHEQENLIHEQSKQISDLQSSRDKVIKQPWFWATMGVLVGGLATGLLLRR